MAVGLGFVLMLPAGFVAWLAGALATMAGDGCWKDRARAICSPATRELVRRLPMWGLGAGLFLVVVAGGIALWRKRTTYPWVALAWLVLMGSVVASCQIAGATVPIGGE